MESEYDRKFDQMKMYIPFLEQMITRLETANGGSGNVNPRQAQLDKIRSLRDLLLDKKKRMKMENLLKCEQVLINLYAKVEQPNTFPGIKPLSEAFGLPSKPKDNLENVRQKLKHVASKEEETLPEIARRSEIEESCTGKEPALFQRRPNKLQSPPRQPSEKKSPQKPRRSYTRVLLSPEPNHPRWSDGDSSQQPLFSRRSPRRSPKRHSSSHKEKKKTSKHTKDLNITLNVPKDSLDSLRTGDIFSRIMNCDDNDVDIATLRDLKMQILGELKQTGAREDISDIIMNSYKTKKKKFKNRKNIEVEEGELSDSESEAIENIYGSLVVVEKEKTAASSSGTKILTDKDNLSRKIQICLVVNTDNEQENQVSKTTTDVTDFLMFDDVDFAKPTKEDKLNHTPVIQNAKTVKDNNPSQKKAPVKNVVPQKLQDVITIDDDEEVKDITTSTIKEKPSKVDEKAEQSISDCNFVDLSTSGNSSAAVSPAANHANFYKPLNESHQPEKNAVEVNHQPEPIVKDISQQPKPNPKEAPHSEPTKEIIDKAMSLPENPPETCKPSTDTTSISSTVESEKNQQNSKSTSENTETNTDQSKDVEIPLLNTDPVQPSPKKDTVSEMEILQALKNELLSEPIPITGAKAVTPALHQPKVAKVANAQGVNKKRISIEKYKQKANPSPNTTPLFINDSNAMSKSESLKSLKLTEAELERFNFPARMALDYSSDEEEKRDVSLDDIYSDLAPKSPENDDALTAGSSTPIIIPVDPVKQTTTSKTDVDMRTLLPIQSPNSCKTVPAPVSSPVPAPLPVPPAMPFLPGLDLPVPPPEAKHEQKRALADPRVRRELSQHGVKESPNPYSFDKTRPAAYPNMIGGMTPNMTPSRAPMTPSRAPMTPSRAPMTPSMTPRSYELPSFLSMDFEDNSSRKHVYASFPMSESRDREREYSVGRDTWESNDYSSEGRKSRWEEHYDDRDRRKSKWEDKRSNYKGDRHHRDQRDDYYSRQECPRTPNPSFGRYDCPSTPNPSFGRRDCPPTPTPSFGRYDCPSTPTPSFGRRDCPATPNPSFGRHDCPSTPNPSFGRHEAPMTPVHPFGRADGSMTPSRALDRSDCPMTPSHPFGRSDTQPVKKYNDPRLNRNRDSNEYESQGRDDNRDYYDDRRKFDNRSYTNDSYRNYNRQQSRHDRNKPFDHSRQNGDRNLHEENSFGRRNYEENRQEHYSASERDYQRAPSVGRTYQPDDRHYRSSSRAPSVGRTQPSDDGYNRSTSRAQSVGRTQRSDDRAQSVGRSYQNTNIENTIEGQSFTIDTSVNRTFQEFLSSKGLPVFEQSFQERRQRATSVGRTLVREPSVGRAKRESSVGRTLKPAPIDETLDYKRIVNFVRARSMGRELSEKKHEKTFKEIKADFQAYSESYNKKLRGKKKDRVMNYRDPRQRKESQHAKNPYQSGTKTAYSPRKNQRDPRMRRDQQNYDKKANRYEDTKKPYGIIYSNDNIAKGTILGSGYGVKNYKIPKIKRPVVEVVEEVKVAPKETVPTKDLMMKKESSAKNQLHEKKTKGKITDKEIAEDTKSKKVIKSKGLEKKEKSKRSERTLEKRSDKDKTTKHKQKVDEDFEDNSTDSDIKRQTRSSNQSNEKHSDKVSSSKMEPSRKFKKAIIESDSDSDDIKLKDLIENDQTETNQNDDLFNSSFGIDDMEIFPAGSADVMANINDLIADLDKEMNNDKSSLSQTESTEKLGKENVLEKIFNQVEIDHSKEESMEESFRDISELINKDSADSVGLPSESSQQPQEINVEAALSKLLDGSDQSLVGNVPTVKTGDQPISESLTNPSDTEAKELDEEKTVSGINNEAIVSTTNIDKVEAGNDDRASTPDSTINDGVKDKSREDGLPDSTNGMQTEMNSDITSTHETAKDASEVTNAPKDNTQQNDSLGSLLSILQDKSKIKELLAMLGGNDNDKIKKKLEKLSELVSDDDEDTNDVDHGPNDDADPGTNDDVEHGTNDNVVPKETVKETEQVSEVEKENNDKIETPSDNVQDSETDQGKAEKESVIEEVNEVKEPEEPEENTEPIKSGPGKSGRKTRKSKLKAEKKIITTKGKRITRSGTAAAAAKPKASRELKQLQNDIKEMFISNDILNATGIRMCRLAKLVSDKPDQAEEEQVLPAEPKPIVVLHKFKDNEIQDKAVKIRKKPGPKPKPKPVAQPENSSDAEANTGKMKTPPTRRKPGPKSKTKPVSDDLDPYAFESDSMKSDVTTPQPSEDLHDSSDSENESIASYRSFASTEATSETKKKKRKRKSNWSAGVISKKKKKNEPKPKDTLEEESAAKMMLEKKVTLPDMDCFVDKTYCFYKDVTTYPCRLCTYSGGDIVAHYRKHHPHSEIPLSRMATSVAKEAIKQCAEIDFHAMSKVPSETYICRFCFKEFDGKKSNLERFFWHVVSNHTGEYKKLCPECVNFVSCPFKLDIPPPPKDTNGQLIGYICGKCHFTQISLENLKIHVIERHNDEQTEVFTINLAVVTEKTIAALLQQPRVLRNRRLNPDKPEADEEQSDDSDEFSNSSDRGNENEKLQTENKRGTLAKVSVKSKLTFEGDDESSETSVKVENVENLEPEPGQESESEQGINTAVTAFDKEQPVSDILDIPHFKVSYNSTGTKEYVCCINGIDNHYKTSLIISMKRHIQTKHEVNWDGYCCLCKVIVMSQGKHNFKDCLQHLLDKHADDIPVLEIEESTQETHVPLQPEPEVITSDAPQEVTQEKTPEKIQSFINVRPLSDLISKEVTSPVDDPTALAKILVHSVVSLGAPEEPTPPMLMYPSESMLERPPPTPVKYEEAQAEIISKKHGVVVNAMLMPEKLVHIFKCAGRFCSYTTDSAEAALIHASTHERVGGENALMCSYCDCDCKGNSIELITHVFKNHGFCQFTCGHCFYRATAAQLVRAHAIRVHGAHYSESVYKTSAAITGEEDRTGILPRKAVVENCVCAVPDCNFKTFILGKFVEHLLKHEPPFLCNICSLSSPSPTQVVQHLKTHGLNLYQCVYCVHGAEHETELLDHASAQHPTKLPQAYLRVINQKEHGMKMTQLPLVQLHKSTIKAKVVTPDSKSDDPVREAERSADLEKLIGPISLFQTPMMNATATRTSNSALDEDNDMDQSPEESFTSDNMEMATLIPEPPRDTTPTPTAATSSEGDISQQVTPVIKTEQLDRTPTKSTPSSSSDVICLDSDEEDSRDSAQYAPNVTDAEKEKSADVTKYVTIPLSSVYKCATHGTVCKTGAALKRHVTVSFDNGKLCGCNCAHCPKKLKSMNDLIRHYTYDHGGITERAQDGRRTKRGVSTQRMYTCGVCNRKDNSLFFIKGHLKNQHKISNVVVASHTENGDFVYVVREAPENTKRKLSESSIEPTPTPPKRKRYSLQDLKHLTKPIFDELAYCAECEFSTKVLSNLTRHLQQHADDQAVPSSVPVNPVPHLETNEMHFDRMVNLASSSYPNAGKPDKPSRSDSTPSVSLQIPPEAATRYPKYVTDRQRYTCGAKDCSYISVDENMLRCHWETLHEGTNNFHCVHCPSNQLIDNRNPLSAPRIIAHFKMHDVNLYACSSCSYYHYKRLIVERHLTEVHKGSGHVLVVREEGNATAVAGTSQAPAAPSMDLKPWQCGLCKFKNMLRQELIEHCLKIHNAKWQFKCPNCPFRGSTIENVSNHQTRVHPTSKDEIIFYYYREGSIVESDGIPLWEKQRQKMGLDEVKTETTESGAPVPAPPPAPVAPKVSVDLNIVKVETQDSECEQPIDELCKRFGQFCEPNGLKYKCPLCKNVSEDSKEALQSHLYEELQYRKWSCAICAYKAFHKTGLHEHMTMEHNLRNPASLQPVELPLDVNIEKWITEVLGYQTELINKSKENLARQKAQVARAPAEAIKRQASQSIQPSGTPNTSKELENLSQTFGKFGAARNSEFCCPKCNFLSADENTMKNHLETELNKIRWRCSSCSHNFQNYHEAQLHCKTCKLKPGARPVEATRDLSVRASWVDAVISVQKQSLKPTDASTKINPVETVEDSLLAVRYEEDVPTPEEEMLKGNTSAPSTSKGPSNDSDDERLVIDEVSTDDSDTPIKRKREAMKKCDICDFSSKYVTAVFTHRLRHYNLKPYKCAYCGVTCHKTTCSHHHLANHPDLPENYLKTVMPSGTPLVINLERRGTRKSHEEPDEPPMPPPIPTTTEKVICLVCEKHVFETEKNTHLHDKKPVSFARKGDVIVKCCICLAFLLDMNAMQEHHSAQHPGKEINYVYHKLNHNTRELIHCLHCNKRFKFIRDLRTHHNTLHGSLPFRYETKVHAPGDMVYDLEQGGSKRSIDDDLLPPAQRQKNDY